MAQHIGIVACSAAGAALCYSTIAVEGAEYMGRHAHPEVSLHTHPLSLYMERIERNDWKGVGELMLDSAERLAKIGADFLICPDNTIHRALPPIESLSPRPWIHIVDAVADAAKALGYTRLALLGTRYTMEGPVYPEKMHARGIEVVTPGRFEQKEINRVIFDELVYGETPMPSLFYFVQVIERMKNQGCDAVVLGCTEIPLLVTPEASPLPTLDSTRLLARAAVRRAVGSTRGSRSA